MNQNELSVGLRVYFGRARGEKTLGEVVGFTHTKVKVKQLEARGVHAAGVVWTVPATLCYPVTDVAYKQPPRPPRVPRPSLEPLVTANGSPLPTTGQFRPGMEVRFGRPNGEKTPGIVVKVNARSIKVRATGSRGACKSGGIWNVAIALVEKV